MPMTCAPTFPPNTRASSKSGTKARSCRSGITYAATAFRSSLRPTANTCASASSTRSGQSSNRWSKSISPRCTRTGTGSSACIACSGNRRRWTRRLHEAVEIRDPVDREQVAEFRVPRVLARLRLRDLRGVLSRAAVTKQLVEIVERRRRARAGIAVVVTKQHLQRDFDARLAIAQVERHVQ